MSAERGSTLEFLQYKVQKVARGIPKITERRREAVRDLRSWEDAVNSTGRAARLSASQNVLREFLHLTESQIDSEKDRLVKLAQDYEQKKQRFLNFSILNNQGVLSREKFEQKRNEFREFTQGTSYFEIRQGTQILADERKRQIRARSKGREYTRESAVYFTGPVEEPPVIFVNQELKAAAVNGKDIRFEEGIEWQTILLLAQAKVNNRYRKDGQYYSAADIKKYFAERGTKVNVSEVISHIQSAVGLENSEVIERVGKTKGTKYQLSGGAVFFSGSDRAYITKGVSLDQAGRPKVVPIKYLQVDSEQPRRTALKDRDSDYNEHVRKAVEAVLALRLPRDGNIKPVQAATVLDLTLTAINRQIERGFIKPQKANDHHPGLTRDDLMAIEYASKFKPGLDSNDRAELSRSFSEEISRRQKDLTQSV